MEVSDQNQDQNVETEVNANVTAEQDELVSKKVVEEYKNDMFKYKSKMKETETRLQQLLDEKALMEKSSLEEKEEWKLLYEKEKEEKAKIQTDLKQKSEFFINSSKINSVVQKLGGFKKDSYTRFIDTSKIDVRDDGTFDQDSISREVDRIKQEYPELLSGNKSAGKMPNEAPSNMSQVQQKGLNQLSEKELRELYTKLNQK